MTTAAESWQYRWLPSHLGLDVERIHELDLDIFGGDIVLPVTVVRQSALEHNLRLFASYCRDKGVELAPHAKTAMSPDVFGRQLELGAWGLTVANAAQARVLRAHGVRRILIANEVVDRGALKWAAAELADTDFRVYCLADSIRGVEIMEQSLANSSAPRPLAVLVELGAEQGRTGCRTADEAERVARAVAVSPHLELAGVESFEGVLADRGVEAIDELLNSHRELTQRIARMGLFAGDEILVSAGGSVFFDRAAEILGAPWPDWMSVTVVLRCGQYTGHAINGDTPFGSRVSGYEPPAPALELWSVVLSRPEPELAVLGFGKRDASYDIAVPQPIAVANNLGQLRHAPGGASITMLNDQHAFLRLKATDELEVGEMVGCGMHHACTAFDRWNLLPLVDDDYRIAGAIRTYF